MSARFLWEVSDLRRRLHDSALGEPGCVSAGERQAVRSPSGPAGEPSRGAWYPDWFADHVGDPPGLRRGFRHQQEQFRGAGHLSPIARRLDDLARELDQRQSEARESGRSAIKALTISMAPRRDQHQSQERNRVPRECVETGALERDQQFARAPDRWVASENRERDELGSSADHFAFSAFDPVEPPIPPARRMGQFNTRPPQSTIAPFTGAGLEAIAPIVKPELPLGARYTDRVSDDVGHPSDAARPRASRGGVRSH